MLSVTKVLDVLQANNFIQSWKKTKTKEYGIDVTSFNVVSDKVKIGNETYGKESYLYFYCGTEDVAKQVYRTLYEAGGKVGTKWNGGLANGCMDLRVCYFKGSRHWE